MINRFCWILLLFIAVSWTDSGQDFRKIPNTTFGKGEFLKFRIHYGVITAGYATLKISEYYTYLNGRKCFHVVGKGQTSSGFDWFYKVRDQYESYIDAEALFPWQFKRHIREGGFESYTETRFDHAQQKAFYTNQAKKIIPFDVPENIQDVISAYYYARTVYDYDELKPGDRISLRNFIDRKTFNLQAEMIGRETIKVSGQSYKTIKMKVLIEDAGLITDGSTITFWASDDKNKIPIRINSELLIGSIKADLVEYANLRHPFTSKVNK